ncbi:hypothetical protein [Streptomyces cyaneofuscatus]|uniref:hypothetical protein n=1 Tax=Streptomyces cyaneofuscatus TaxID=66883 RepID=UPI0038123564
MNVRKGTTAMLLAGYCLMAAAPLAAADGGSDHLHPIAMVMGSGSATASAVGSDAGGDDGVSVPPPVVGDPSSGTLQYASTSVSTVVVNATYSCPVGSPADARIDVSVGQNSGALGVDGVVVTCDGTQRSAQITVESELGPLYSPGPAVVTLTLYSPSNSDALYQYYSATITI